MATNGEPPLSGSTAIPGSPAPLTPLQYDSSSRQGTLFSDDFPVPDVGVGYRGPVACAAAGISYRQLDYWARTGLVEPTVRAAASTVAPCLIRFSARSRRRTCW